MCRVCAVGEDAHPTSEWKIGNRHSDKSITNGTRARAYHRWHEGILQVGAVVRNIGKCIGQSKQRISTDES